jgi:uncharacterized membrane protein
MMIRLGYGLVTMLFGLVGVIAGIALLVLIFMVLVKANKLLGLRIEKAEAERNKMPPVG